MKKLIVIHAAMLATAVVLGACANDRSSAGRDTASAAGPGGGGGQGGGGGGPGLSGGANTGVVERSHP